MSILGGVVLCDVVCAYKVGYWLVLLDTEHLLFALILDEKKKRKKTFFLSPIFRFIRSIHARRAHTHAATVNFLHWEKDKKFFLIFSFDIFFRLYLKGRNSELCVVVVAVIKSTIFVCLQIPSRIRLFVLRFAENSKPKHLNDSCYRHGDVICFGI